MGVAVIIPAYNAGPFIRRAIESVLAQTISVDEVIVIDDGSTDDTCKIVAAYGPFVTLLSQINGGPARARNLGVRSCSSQYIAFLDADDAWLPDKIQRQLDALTADPAGNLCYTGLTLVHVDGTRMPARLYKPNELQRILRTQNPSLTPSCVMVTREAFLRSGGFDEHHRGCEDWELWFRLWQLGPFLCVEQPLTLYQVSVSGLSSDADHMMRDFQQMLEPLLLKDLQGTRRRVWRRRILSEQCYRAALTARAAHRTRKALRYHLRSMLLWPSPRLLPTRFFALLMTVKSMLSERHGTRTANVH